MTVVLILLLIQGVMGAVDTFYHHELGGLPSRPSARREIGLHALREAIYGVIFLSLGWVAWTGVWAIVLAALIVTEVVITLTDFLEEDRTRTLAPSERLLHTLMAISFGVIVAAIAPTWLTWLSAPTGFEVSSHGVLSILTSLFGVGVLVWAVRDGLAWRNLWAEPGMGGVSAPSGRTVLITGATGFIGAPLVEARMARGDRVLILARDVRAARARFGSSVRVFDDLTQIPGEVRIDAIINLAGAPTAGGLWTRRRKALLLGSRLGVTRAVNTLIARLEHKPAALISASAVGYYGDRGDELLDEAAGPRPGFMSDLCRLWEDEAKRAPGYGVRVCLLRIGLVFDWSGGPLPLLALPGRFGLGAVFGSGRQWLPWIHRDDVLRIIDLAIEDERCAGPLNVVTPPTVTQGEFARLLAKVQHRPLWLAAPARLMRPLMGEFSDLFLAGQRVSPARLAGLGYRFVQGDLEAVLAGPARARGGVPAIAVVSHGS